MAPHIPNCNLREKAGGNSENILGEGVAQGLRVDLGTFGWQGRRGFLVCGRRIRDVKMLENGKPSSLAGASG